MMHFYLHAIKTPTYPMRSLNKLNLTCKLLCCLRICFCPSSVKTAAAPFEYTIACNNIGIYTGQISRFHDYNSHSDEYFHSP